MCHEAACPEQGIRRRMEGQLDFEVYGLILYLAFFVFIRFILSVAHSMKRQCHQLKVFYKFSSAYKVKPSTVILSKPNGRAEESLNKR